MTANNVLIWNYRCPNRFEVDSKLKENGWASLFSHESICLLTSSVWAQNTSNHREYIHIDITEVELLCRLLLLLFRIFIDINTRAFNRLKQRKRNAKKTVRGTQRISIVIEVQYDRIPFSFLYSIFDVLFCAKHFMFTFHLFVSFFFSSVLGWFSFICSGCCLEFSHFQASPHKFRRQWWSNSLSIRHLHVGSHSFRYWCVIRNLSFSWDFSCFLSLFPEFCSIVCTLKYICAWCWYTRIYGYVVSLRCTWVFRWFFRIEIHSIPNQSVSSSI